MKPIAIITKNIQGSACIIANTCADRLTRRTIRYAYSKSQVKVIFRLKLPSPSAFKTKKSPSTVMALMIMPQLCRISQ
jgi:hypothetical protein